MAVGLSETGRPSGEQVAVHERQDRSRGALHIPPVPTAARGPVLLWRRTFSNPKQVCSVFPSSPAVGRAMAEFIADRDVPAVVELGAGTGAVTRQLLQSGLAPADLTCVEIDPLLASHLERRFPGVEVLRNGAETLSRAWHHFGRPKVGAVVSTLPMRVFPDELSAEILRSCFDIMHDSAGFAQFTYRRRSPVARDVVQSLGLVAGRYRKVWANLPPATIWVYQKRRPKS